MGPRGRRVIGDAVALVVAVALLVTGHGGQGAWVGWAWAGWAVVTAAVGAWLSAGWSRPGDVAVAHGVVPVAAAWMVPGLLSSSVPPALAVWALAGLVMASASALLWCARVMDWCRRPVGVVVGVMAGLDVVALVVLRDPFREATCLPACDPNPLLLWRRHDLVRLADGLWSITALGLGVLLVVVAARRVLRHRSAVCWSALLVATGTVIVAADRLAAPRPGRGGDRLRWVIGSSTVAVTVGFALVALPAVTSVRARRRVRRLVRQLAAATDLDTVTDLLRRATGDAGLVIQVVDPAWPSVDPGPAVGAGAIEVRRDGILMAMVHHRDSSAERVREALTPVVVLSIENAVMLARAERQARDLAGAQRRLVELADTQRRRLERDLHDGAQQQLLVLGMDLQASAARADAHDAAVLSQMAASAAQTLGRLRNLARGAVPGALDHVSMAEGLFSLAEESVVPMRVDVDEHGTFQLGRAGAAAAHRAVRLVVAEATEHGASRVDLRVRAIAGQVVLSLAHDGQVCDPLTEPADRVRAAGGSWVSAIGPGAVTYEARFPCE